MWSLGIITGSYALWDRAREGGYRGDLRVAGVLLNLGGLLLFLLGIATLPITGPLALMEKLVRFLGSSSNPEARSQKESKNTR